MDRPEQFSWINSRKTMAIFVVFFALLSGVNPLIAQNKSYPFKQGEKMTYSVHFGWFNIGEAEVWIDPELHYENGEPHYLISCNISSAPWFKLLKKIDMCFESLVRASDLRPVNSIRDLKQGGRIDIRSDQFVFGDSIKVNAYVEDVDSHRYHTFPKTEVPFRDALSTYLYLRNQDLHNLNDKLSVRTFFTNSLYEFHMAPDGRGKFKLMGERVQTREFKLLFPPSSLVPKGQEGSVVVSADERRIPLKFKMNLSLGSFMLELEDISYE